MAAKRDSSTNKLNHLYFDKQWPIPCTDRIHKTILISLTKNYFNLTISTSGKLFTKKESEHKVYLNSLIKYTNLTNSSSTSNKVDPVRYCCCPHFSCTRNLLEKWAAIC